VITLILAKIVIKDITNFMELVLKIVQKTTSSKETHVFNVIVISTVKHAQMKTLVTHVQKVTKSIKMVFAKRMIVKKLYSLVNATIKERK